MTTDEAGGGAPVPDPRAAADSPRPDRDGPDPDRDAAPADAAGAGRLAGKDGDGRAAADAAPGAAAPARASRAAAPDPTPRAAAPDLTSRAATPDIAVVVPHYNDPARLAKCLAALEEEGFAGAEVVVVDNGSDRAPPPPELVAAHPAIRFLVEPAPGAAMARNAGVAATTAPNLLFVDADCVPCPGWLAAARAAVGAAELVGGHVGVFDETPPPRSGAEAFEAVFAFDFRTYIERQGFSGAGNLLTTRAVFEDVGGFRAGVSEDKDWTQRAVARGHRLVYRAEMAVLHPSRPDWPALERKWRRLTDESWGLHLAEWGAAGETDPAGGAGAAGPAEDGSGRGAPAPRGARLGARAAWAGRALLMPASVLAHLPRVLRAPALDGPGERARAAGTLARLRLARMAWMLRQALSPAP